MAAHFKCCASVGSLTGYDVDVTSPAGRPGRTEVTLSVRSPEDGYQSPLRDSVQHRAFANRRAELVGLGYAIVGVSSQALDVQRRVIADTGVRHMLLSDPDLVLAQTLGLPTFRLDQPNGIAG